jgi:tetratricopeptide (TPR) repeat protein
LLTPSKQHGIQVTKMELTVDQALRQGIAAHTEGKLQDAERLYRAILQAQPKHPDANHNLGVLAVAAGKHLDAVPLFMLALDANPKIEQFWLSYIDVLMRLERVYDAKQVLADAKEAGFTSQKLSVLRQRIQQSPAENNKNARKALTLSEKRKQVADKKKIRKTSKASTSTAPSQERMNSLIGHYQSGRFTEAEKLARLLTKEFPKHPFGWKAFGLVLKHTGRLDESLLPMQKSVELSPLDAEAIGNLGVTLQELGRLKEAEVSCRQAIALEAGAYLQHNNLGNTLKKLGRLDESEASFRQAIALKPDYAEAHSNLGGTLSDQGRLDEAEASYKQAIALKPDFAEAHSNLGVLFFESRRYDQAAKHFEQGDTHLSKRYAIQCSYLQDEASIFNGKYDLLVSEGEINAVIGSLGVRSELEYGTKKANPFCNEPFRYVVRTDLRTQYEFEKIFVQTAREVLADSEVSFKAQGLLTNGIQTAGNIFVQGNVPQTEIENIIRTEIEKYRIKFKDSDEGFIKKWPTAYDIKGWLVCMQSGGKLHPHMHDRGWITGSVYINVPPKSKADSGNLVLCLRDGDHPLVPGQQSSIDVVTGSLCLFPSSLHHYTVPFDENEERIVLAFDVVPKAIPSNSTTQILE